MSGCVDNSLVIGATCGPREEGSLGSIRCPGEQECPLNPRLPGASLAYELSLTSSALLFYHIYIMKLVLKRNELLLFFSFLFIPR